MYPLQVVSDNYAAFEAGTPGLYTIDCIPCDGSFHVVDPVEHVDPGVRVPIQTASGKSIKQQEAGFSKNHGFKGVYKASDRSKHKTRRRLKPEKVSRAEEDRASVARGPQNAPQQSLLSLLVWLATVSTLTDFYGSRTSRWVKFMQYRKRQATLTKIVKDIAPDPRTIVVWGANFFGMRSGRGRGREYGRVPARAIRRKFAKERRVVLVNEYHTSKKSCCCGCDQEYDAKKRVVTCEGCGESRDRDLNGAINMRRVWEQHLSNGMRPRGLEIPTNSRWAKLESTIAASSFWSQMGH